MAGINTDYSRFYKGSESINHYGSGSGQKDTVVRYEFNTTDAHGNKVMDKMSKEETMKAVNDISSMYGDNVTVEFSGDGMAALADHKLMKDFPVEQREAAEVTFLEGPKPLTEEQLAEMNKTYGDNTGALMKAYDPKSYNEMLKVQEEGVASGTKEGLVAGMRYMYNWINKTAASDPGWVDKAKKLIEDDKSNNKTEDMEGVVKKTTKTDKADRSAIVQQLKAELEERKNQLMEMVRKTLSGQIGAFGKASGDSFWKTLAGGNYTVDAATKAQAQKDIGEDGYWGVKQTSKRLFDFASALAGDDVDKMKDMQKAMEKGFKLATKAWGRELPKISRDTLDAANKLFEDYYRSKEQDNTTQV